MDPSLPAARAEPNRSGLPVSPATTRFDFPRSASALKGVLPAPSNCAPERTTKRASFSALHIVMAPVIRRICGLQNLYIESKYFSARELPRLLAGYQFAIPDPSAALGR